MVVSLATQDCIDDQGFQSSVPSAPGLRGARVDLGGRERQLARVVQDREVELLLFSRGGEIRDFSLHDLDDSPDQIQRLTEADRPSQFPWHRGKHVSCDAWAGGWIGVPGDERGDSDLCHQTDP